LRSVGLTPHDATHTHPRQRSPRPGRVARTGLPSDERSPDVPSLRMPHRVRGEALLGSVEPPEERTIEYNEEALRRFEEDP
jgi:hypothetical protein